MVSPSATDNDYVLKELEETGHEGFRTGIRRQRARAQLTALLGGRICPKRSPCFKSDSTPLTSDQ